MAKNRSKTAGRLLIISEIRAFTMTIQIANNRIR